MNPPEKKIMLLKLKSGFESGGIQFLRFLKVVFKNTPLKYNYVYGWNICLS